MSSLKIARNIEERKLLDFLRKNENLKKAVFDIEKIIGSFDFYIIQKKSIEDEGELKKELCRHSKSGRLLDDSCLLQVVSIKEKIKNSKKIEIVKLADKAFAFFYTLKHNQLVFGYAVGMRLKEEPSLAQLEIFEHFIDSVLFGVEKELELEELNKTVTPRVIALSTVHTLHRLISSSLYLNELLSRVARLSMQIIKANRCSIKLVDSKRKSLLPKATVDLRNVKAKLKKVKIGRWAPGKAVKYGKAVRGDRYLAVPLIDEDTIGVITLYDKVDKKPFNNFDVEIMKTLAEQAAVAIKNAQLYEEQEKLTMGSIKALAQIIESRSIGISIPKASFLRIVHLVGHEFDLRENELKTLQYATLLHDTGEVMVPESVIRKRGKLTKKEFKIIKEHPLKGAKVIKSLKSLKPIAPIIMSHHENYNGSGYPKGLKGSEIPLGARILAVVDAFEAMITKRSYRVALSIKGAIEEIKKYSGKQFDPKVVQVFLKIILRKDILKMLKNEIRVCK